MENLPLYLIVGSLVFLLVRRLKKANNAKLAAATKSTPKRNKEVGEYIIQTAIGRGARWFYWIAGLSAANTVIYLSNGNLEFPVGLFVTQIIDVFGKELRLMEVGVAINAIIISLFVLIGYKASKFSKLAFIAGLILYILDLIILLLFMVIGKSFTDLIVNIILHLLALKSIYYALKLIQKKSVSAPSKAS